MTAALGCQLVDHLTTVTEVIVKHQYSCLAIICQELSDLVKQRQAGLLVTGAKTVAGTSQGHPQLNMFQRQKQLR
jgi:hypothetical protein